MTKAWTLASHDLQAQAREALRLGKTYCTDCGNYHQLWSLLRAAGLTGGTAVNDAVVEPLLAELLSPGARVLIAGAADGELLALVARAAGGREVAVTVADRCRTPLKLISKLEPRASVQLRTVQADLTRIQNVGEWDLILSHLMLPFLSAPDQARMLTGFQRALRPGGRLVMVVRVAEPVSDEDAHDQAWIAAASAAIKDAGLDALLSSDELRPMLATYAAARRRRTTTFSSSGQVEELIKAAGLQVERTATSDLPTSIPVQGRATSKQTYVFVCR